MFIMKHNKTFNLHNGKKFKDLKGLARELKNMTDEVFLHHVNDKKNDFSNWMENSLNEEKLADNVEKAIDKIETELEVLRHLVHTKVKKKEAIEVKVETLAKPKTTKKVTKKVVKKETKE